MGKEHKFELMRGEIATLLIAGVLVVAGVGVLLSSTLNQNKRTTNTKASEGCSIESINADLSGRICKFTINYTPDGTHPSPRDLVCALINPKRDASIAFNQLVAEQRAQLPAGWDVFGGSKNGRLPLFPYSQYNDHLSPAPDGGNYRLVVYDWRRIQTDPNCVRTVDIPSGIVTSTFGGGGGGTENPTNTPVPGGAQQPTPTATNNIYLPFVANGNTPTPGGSETSDTNASCLTISGSLSPEGSDTPKKITLTVNRIGNKFSGEMIVNFFGDGRDGELFINNFPQNDITPDSIVILPEHTKTENNPVQIPSSGIKKIVFEAGIRVPGGNYKCKKEYLTCHFSKAERFCSLGGLPSDATGSAPPTPTTVPAGQATPTPTPSSQPSVQSSVQITINEDTFMSTCTNQQVQAWISANIKSNGRPLVIPEATCTAVAKFLR